MNPLKSLLGEARAGIGSVADALESTAGAGQRHRLLRLADPWDLAGKAARSALPSHATPALAHGVYYVVLGGFVLAELVEPPMALLLAAGHLMLQSHNHFAEEAGAALDDSA
ncbi:MAG: hypothetical protein NVS3B26_02130 [Mycobacteriales bacterium]